LLVNCTSVHLLELSVVSTAAGKVWIVQPQTVECHQLSWWNVNDLADNEPLNDLGAWRGCQGAIVIEEAQWGVQDTSEEIFHVDGKWTWVGSIDGVQKGIVACT